MSDHLDRAAEVIAAQMHGLMTPSMCRGIAWALEDAGMLVSPERDAAVAAKALRDAAKDMRDFADIFTEQGDHHVSGCEGQADCAACVRRDLRALAYRIERGADDD